VSEALAQPVPALEDLLEGRGLARKAAALSLLLAPGGKLTRASDLPSPSAPRDPIPTRVPALDRLLGGGLPRGGFVELSGRRSCGRFSIGISTLASATSCGEAAALVDLGGHLDPQAAEDAGVDLARLLWVRPEKLKDAVASAEMLLATGFPLVVVDLGLAPVRGRFVPDAAWVRLERAARSRGAALLLLAPYRVSGVAAGTVLSAGAARADWKGLGRAPRLLCGIASRVALEKDARARTGVGETVGFVAAEAISSRRGGAKGIPRCARDDKGGVEADQRQLGARDDKGSAGADQGQLGYRSDRGSVVADQGQLGYRSDRGSVVVDQGPIGHRNDRGNVAANRRPIGHSTGTDGPMSSRGAQRRGIPFESRCG